MICPANGLARYLTKRRLPASDLCIPCSEPNLEVKLPWIVHTTLDLRSQPQEAVLQLELSVRQNWDVCQATNAMGKDRRNTCTVSRVSIVIVIRNPALNSIRGCDLRVTVRPNATGTTRTEYYQAFVYTSSAFTTTHSPWGSGSASASCRGTCPRLRAWRASRAPSRHGPGPRTRPRGRRACAGQSYTGSASRTRPPSPSPSRGRSTAGPCRG